MEPTFCLEITRGDAGGSALRVELQLMLVSPLGVGKQGNLHMQDPGLSAGSCTASGLASTGGLLVGLCLCLRAPAQCLPFSRWPDIISLCPACKPW